MRLMSDQYCIDFYTNRLADLWESVYKKMGPIDGHKAKSLTEAINAVHQLCGVPSIVSFASLNKNDPNNGCFIPSSWSINLNYYLMNKPSDPGVHNFLNLAEALYHEARHAEQHWLVVCMAAAAIRKINRGESLDSNSSKKSSDLVKNLSSLPRYITEKAWRAGETFNPSSELRQKITEWYDSMYLNRYDLMSNMGKAYENPVVNDGTWLPELKAAYDPYRYSPHEYDAFSMGGLVYKKLADMLNKMGEIPDLISFTDSNVNRRKPTIPRRPANWGNCCILKPPPIPPRAGGLVF